MRTVKPLFVRDNSNSFPERPWYQCPEPGGFTGDVAVKTHQRHLYQKLGARSRSEAVEQARALGLLALSGHVVVWPSLSGTSA
jgi:hypothetical protein